MRVGGRFILIVVLALLASLQAAADESPAWTAWLHYGRHMTLIDSNGDTLREVDLSFDADDHYWLLDVSPDGDKVAFGVQTKGEAVINFNQITVYSLAENADNREIFTHPLYEHERGYYSINQKVFDETGNFLAVSDYMGDLRWQIIVFNVYTGHMVYRLTDEDMIDVEGDFIPVVRDYRGLEIAFSLIRNDHVGNSEAYIWDTSTSSIVENIAYVNLRADTFEPTGEVIMQYENDGRFYNNLFVYDPIKQARYPFFAISTYTADVFFVQNGERIIDQMYEPMGASNWILIERDGTRVHDFSLGFYSPGMIPAYINADEVKGTLNGFIYSPYFELLESSSRLPLPVIYEVDTRDDKLDVGRVIWQMPMKEFHSYFEPSEQQFFDIAWVHSDAPVGPFKPWAQLADPVYAPTPQPSDVTITPTLIPTPPPLFHVGQTVRVQTIDGEILNLRAEPTRKSEIVVYIEDDTHLELLEGPVEAEGFNWWRVRLPDGLEGWVVENDGELQTLMPHSP